MRLRTTTSRQQSRRYRELFESHPVAMAVWDPSTGEVLAANDAALRQYGYEASEIRGLPEQRQRGLAMTGMPQEAFGTRLVDQRLPQLAARLVQGHTALTMADHEQCTPHGGRD